MEICIEEPLHPREACRNIRAPLNLPSNFSTSPFPELSPSELAEDWGKELKLALCFAADFDLFRAITGFKRALFLLPPGHCLRKLEIEYDIALAYYLGKKYMEAVWAVEGCELVAIDSTFPAFHDLLLVLYDSRKHLGQEKEANHLLSLIEQFDSCEGKKLTLLSALERTDLELIKRVGSSDPGCAYMCDIASTYCCERKSIKKAGYLNAVLPGAGYWYVGQKQTAVTAFLINSLFIAAATEFFIHGYTAAGAIMLTLESGWYFGGIYGGGLAAKYYNERLYETYATRISQREKLFPLMMIRYTF